MAPHRSRDHGNQGPLRQTKHWHLLIISAYAPVQQGGNNSQRTDQFYEKLAEKTREARAKGDLVVIGGDMNASVRQNYAPNLIGKWASHKEGANSESLINFMLEQKMAAINTFQQTHWRRRYMWSRGASKSMIDFFLCPECMLK